MAAFSAGELALAIAEAGHEGDEGDDGHAAAEQRFAGEGRDQLGGGSGLVDAHGEARAPFALSGGKTTQLRNGRRAEPVDRIAACRRRCRSMAAAASARRRGDHLLQARRSRPAPWTANAAPARGMSAILSIVGDVRAMRASVVAVDLRQRAARHPPPLSPSAERDQSSRRRDGVALQRPAKSEFRQAHRRRRECRRPIRTSVGGGERAAVSRSASPGSPLASDRPAEAFAATRPSDKGLLLGIGECGGDNSSGYGRCCRTPPRAPGCRPVSTCRRARRRAREPRRGSPARCCSRPPSAASPARSSPRPPP